MKNTLFVLIILSLNLGCKKENTPPGSLEIAVSYYYSAIQTRPDVGSVAHLYESKYYNLISKDSTSAIEATVGFIYDAKGKDLNAKVINEGKADASGKISITGIAEGTYLLVVASSGQYRYSFTTVTILSGITSFEDKYFGRKNFWDDDFDSW